MGYQLKKHEPYVITGIEGKEYVIPAALDLGIDGIKLSLAFDNAKDEVEKVKACKAFFLYFAPDLEKEEIGDMEYFNIFQDYNKSGSADKKKLGES